MAKILVTGGAGFIGSNLVEALLKRGDTVRVLDNFSTGKRENLGFPELSEKGGGALEVMEGDVADPSLCRTAVENMDYVLHQAAIPSVPRSLAQPVETNRANIDGTLLVRDTDSVSLVTYDQGEHAMLINRAEGQKGGEQV